MMAQHEEQEVVATDLEMKKPKRHDESVGLNITSLMDAISIILCYLLVSINMDPWSIKQNQYLSLAQSTVDTEPRDSMAVIVNRQEILVDNTKVLPVECMTSEAKGARQCRTAPDFELEDNSYSIDKVYKEDGSEESFKVTALLSVLQEKLVGAREMHQARGSEGEFRAMATVICDKNIPYRMIAEVINTMGQAGIENIRFAIMQGERWVP
jgi:biopolymer transport protein ExbD